MKKFYFFCGIVLISILTNKNIFFKKANFVYYQKITVVQDDNLWNIASRYTNSNKNTKEKVIEIIQFNKLDNLSIQPGQEILIPMNEKE